MKLYIVRHGETDWNKQHLLQGDVDVPLNETGIDQANKVKELLENKPIDLCISSPLSRTYNTAKIISDNKYEIITDSRLIERGFGELEGKSVSNYDTHLYWNYQLNINNQGIERIQDLFHRVEEFYQELKKNYSDQTVLIVTHGAIVRAFHYIIKGYDENTKFLTFAIPNCKIMEYEVKSS